LDPVTLDEALQRADELRAQGRYADAEVILAPLVARVDAEYGAQSAPAADVRNARGLLFKAIGQYEQARACYLEALAVLQATAGTADDLATLYHNLAGIDFVLGNLDQAAVWGRHGLNLRRAGAGPDHLTVLYDEGNLAPILIAAGELDQAERLLTHVHEQFVAQLGEDDYEVAVTLTNLGALAAERGDLPTALDRLTAAAEIKTARLGPAHPELIRTLINIAVAAENLGETDRSARAHARALNIAETTLPPDHELRRTLENW
jgi:tetratricopeptide (TPR) repeat protein